MINSLPNKNSLMKKENEKEISKQMKNKKLVFQK